MKGYSRFRSSFTYMEGYEPADWVQGKIINVNVVNWTVDVIAQFDRKYWFDIQVGSPYLHYNNGEGISVFPEVGAKCMVCLPSDSSPPFVGAFLMPVEVTDMAAQDAPQGTTSQSSPGAKASGASFAGGRPQAQPGDIWMRTRDDNFVVLHRGGVVQIGATELAQRIYIPVGHLIMDVSQNYAHHNAGGSILWSLQTGPALTNYPSEYTHSFRVYANTAGADIRVKAGKVSDPIPEPSGSNGNQADINSESLGQGTGNFIIYEVDVAPLGFNPETGAPIDPKNISNNTVLRFFFDREGGAFLRCEGSLVVASKNRLLLRGDQGIDIKSGADLSMKASSGMSLDGGDFTKIQGTVVRLGPGSRPVGYQGSLVQVIIPPTPVPAAGLTSPSGPVTGTCLFPGGTYSGVLTVGEPSVMT